MASDWSIVSARGPQAGLLGLKAMLADVWSARGLAWRLLHRDISAKYRQSLLGYIWAVVPPLAVTLSFTLAGQAAILNIADVSLPYPVFALVGTVLWQTFADAVFGPIKAVSSAKSLLARIRFPHEAIVLAKMGEVAFNLLIRLVLILAVLWLYGIAWSPGMLLAPLAIGILILLGTAIGMLLAPLGGLYSDVEMTLALFMSFWFFVTPVMYEQAAAHSVIGALNTFNPVSPALVSGRQLLTGVAISDWAGLATTGSISLVLILGSWMVYRRSLIYMIERVSA
jgi:lipopolysaccharide transport system permease protein